MTVSSTGAAFQAFLAGDARRMAIYDLSCTSRKYQRSVLGCSLSLRTRRAHFFATINRCFALIVTRPTHFSPLQYLSRAAAGCARENKGIKMKAFASVMPCSRFHSWERLVLCIVMMLLAVCHAGLSRAAGTTESAPNRQAEILSGLSDATQGTLALPRKEGGYLAAPMLKTNVTMRITGMVARVKVEQQFTNPTAEWQEGVYVFPLPEKAAVDHLKMRIGERIIEGQIKERSEARKVYEQAKLEGKKATLLEQERPNIFTSSVAHIGPNETVQVEIEYQQTLRYDQGLFRLRFPMAMTPRYIPGVASVEPVQGFGAQGWARDTDAVPDASRITPPVPHPATGYAIPLTLSIDLDAGFPLATLTSSYHPITVSDAANDRKKIILSEGAIAANKDFELVWAPQLGAAPQAALFREQKDGKQYALLMVMPPAPNVDAAASLPREAIFIIDTSGSMEGQSMNQAKEALQMALNRLKPGDRFNVIQFNSVTETLFQEAMPVDAQSLARARAFVSKLHAGGGTEMLPALSAALNGKESPGRVRQVLFLTDGAVGNEQQLFEFIKANLGDSRLFTVGIGSAPNSHFMTKAAEFGRGTFTYIGNISEVKEKMTALFAKVESPVLANLNIRWPGGQQAEVWPKRIPDLYAGEPLVISARLDSLAGNVAIEGNRGAGGTGGASTWHQSIPLNGGRAESGIATLWAREKIEDLMSTLKLSQNEDEVKAAVMATALTHHLVSKYTSLVAVDVTPSRPEGAISKSGMVPSPLPEGTSHEAIFGTLPQTATAAELNLLIGMTMLLMAGWLRFKSLRAARFNRLVR